MSGRTELNQTDALHEIKVMVVDDHPMWRDAVARDLAAAGFDVVATAGDGPEAVRRAPAASPTSWSWTSTCPACPGSRSARNWSAPTRR